jgi:hypothetical protein
MTRILMVILIFDLMQAKIHKARLLSLQKLINDDDGNNAKQGQ